MAWPCQPEIVFKIFYSVLKLINHCSVSIETIRIEMKHKDGLFLALSILVNPIYLWSLSSLFYILCTKDFTYKY